MNRKMVMTLAVSGALAGLAGGAYAQEAPKPEGDKRELQHLVAQPEITLPWFIAEGDEKKDPPKPELIAAGDDEKKDPPKPELIAAGDDEKKDPPKPELIAAGDDEKKDPPKPELIAAGDDEKKDPPKPELMLS